MERRTFLKWTGAIGTALLAGEVGHQYERGMVTDWLTNPDTYHFVAAGKLPDARLCGVMLNAPWYYLESDARQGLATLPEYISGLRMMIDDAFEPQRGVYAISILEQIAALDAVLTDGGRTLQVDIINGFRMSESWNPSWGWLPATSPYAADGLYAFYTNAGYRQAYRERVKRIAAVLNPLQSLVAVTVGNELVPPNTSDGKAVFADWYAFAVAEIAREFPGKAILSGLYDPLLLDPTPEDVTATTIHVYPFVPQEKTAFAYATNANVPLVVQEVGKPYQAFGIDLKAWNDAILSDYLIQTIGNMSRVAMTTRTVTLATPSIGIWKYGSHEDGYGFDPHIHTMSATILQQFGVVCRMVRNNDD